MNPWLAGFAAGVLTLSLLVLIVAVILWRRFKDMKVTAADLAELDAIVAKNAREVAQRYKVQDESVVRGAMKLWQ